MMSAVLIAAGVVAAALALGWVIFLVWLVVTASKLEDGEAR